MGEWWNWAWLGLLVGFLGFIVGALGVLVGLWSVISAFNSNRRTKSALNEIKILTELNNQYHERIKRMSEIHRRLDWTDVEDAARETARWLSDKKKNDFDFIFAPGPRGAIFGQRIIHCLDRDVPIVVGVTRPIDQKSKKLYSTPLPIENHDWFVELPSIIESLRSSSILIVDDYARGGNFMSSMKERLIKDGFDESKITTVVMISMKHAFEARRIDFAWDIYQKDDFRFPWGKAI